MPIRRIRVSRGGKIYIKRITGGQLLNNPKVRALARKHKLKPSKQLLRGCYGTFYGPGGRYIVWNRGNPKVVIRKSMRGKRR